ncbi:hypothetical protein A1O1_00046 [Capronia coronata CBS 617.96]|uniref:Uncharacterized protein n=1 Tax=Capronia coronata CBS 617.96 TaxID=1182541 RepID=W9YQX6_9EURO|nr:uncharacterized protein A1O1_00046 [Capronia coronata CBS 617.96]EXJ94928.1 hypothetical protein A1O1_00046 [Capronia coronata CBS 617.96]
MPDNEEKMLLHQDFWRHRRNCARCSGRVKPSSYAWQNTVCPLEYLVKRNIKDVPADGDATLRRIKEPAAKKVKLEDDDGIDEQQLIAEGKVKVTYEIDDDFDAAAAGKTGLTRTIWIQDYSLMEFKVEEVIKTEEDDTIYEEITISTLRKTTMVVTDI